MQLSSILTADGERMVILGVIAAYWLSITLAIVGWVNRDSRARGCKYPVFFALFSTFVPFGLVYYLYWRYHGGGSRGRATPTTKRERAYATWASATVGALLGMGVVAPPDPFTQLRYLLVGTVVLFPVAYLLVYRRKYQEIRAFWSG